MTKYYTRACNFKYNFKTKTKKSNNIFIGNYKEISFDTIELISRKSKKTIKVNNIKKLNKKLKNKVFKDLKNISKKKNFLKFNFSKQPFFMGIINLTPDSFSDGGIYNNNMKAFKRAKELLNYGCDIIDLGGESTRPGSKTVDEKKEWNRIRGPLKKISKLKVYISIDTRKTFVMRNAYKIKMNILNDISSLNYDTKTLEFLKKTKLPFVIHHIQKSPKNMQLNPRYRNVCLDIYDFFENKLKEIRQYGINHNNIILDPGIGFGKNMKHNITLLKNISLFHSLGYPLLVGTSRKRFIKDISKNNDSKKRYGGTISSCLYLMMQGVQFLRVHDLNEVKQAMKTFKALY